jgi:hypothetical protein
MWDECLQAIWSLLMAYEQNDADINNRYSNCDKFLTELDAKIHLNLDSGRYSLIIVDNIRDTVII